MIPNIFLVNFDLGNRTVLWLEDTTKPLMLSLNLRHLGRNFEAFVLESHVNTYNILYIISTINLGTYDGSDIF